MLKKIAIIVGAAFGSVLVIALFRTFMLTSSRDDTLKPVSVNDSKASDYAQHLSDAIKIKTISTSIGKTNLPAFRHYHSYLETTYPLTHQSLTRTIINDASVIFHWRGSDPAIAPVALAAHQDVVPVEAGTHTEWQQPPWSGAIVDGRIWGRGTLDDKGSMIAILEATEELLSTGFQPQGDIYFLFGHDEELGGFDGAGKIVKHLQAKGIRFAWALDEGSAPVRRVVPGYDGTIALISLAEKGSTTLQLTATAEGGHSSTPGPDTAASLLARAVVEITDHPYPLEFDQHLITFLHAIAPELPFAQRFALSNLWLTGSFVKKQLGQSPLLAASMRTTTAATIMNSGTKTNILPQKGVAYVNYRIHPRNAPEDILRRARKLTASFNVTINPAGAVAASEVASPDTKGYQQIENAIRKTHGGIIIAPSFTLQGTDMRHYGKIADNGYRFFPFIVEPEDLQRIHGTGEFITIENLYRGVHFYKTLLEQQ